MTDNQLNLFEWAEARKQPVIIDALPALCRRSAMEEIYKIPRPTVEAKIIPIDRKAA